MGGSCASSIRPEARYVDTSNEFSQERVVQEDDPRSWVGKNVVHASFGRGKVRDAVRHKKDEFKLVVDFNADGRKTVLSSYVKVI